MEEFQQLRTILEDFVDVMHNQTKEIEKLVINIERVIGPLKEESRFALVASELSELRARMKKIPV